MAVQTNNSVKSDFVRALSQHPGRYSFFASVRRLEQFTPGAPRTGTADAALSPVARFAQVPHLYFPPSELAGFNAGHGNKADTMQLYFFGMFGPNGGLPLPFTEYAHERSLHFYDLSTQRFADIFHDRLAALFYRAGTRGQAALSYDIPQDDPLSAAAAELAAMPATEGSMLPPAAPVRQARRLAHRDNPLQIRFLLQDFFGFPVQLQEHTPQRLSIPQESRCRLGHPGTCELGRTALLGESQRSISDCVTADIGPLDYEQYRRFRPGSTGHRRLQAWLRTMTTRPMRWELRFRIRSASIPALPADGSCCLGGDTLFPSATEEYTTCTLTCNL